MLIFGKNSKRARILREQDEKFRRFQSEIKEEPLEKNDLPAMIIGAFWALWPALAAAAGIILAAALFFFR